MNKIEEAIKDYWGERCKEFFKGCACCEAWKEYDNLIKTSDTLKGMKDKE